MPEFDPLEYAQRSLDEENVVLPETDPLVPPVPEELPQGEPQEDAEEPQLEFEEIVSPQQEDFSDDEVSLPSDLQGQDEALPLSFDDQSREAEVFEEMVPVPGQSEAGFDGEDGPQDFQGIESESLPGQLPGELPPDPFEEVWSVNPPQTSSEDLEIVTPEEPSYDEQSLRDFSFEQLVEQDSPEDIGEIAPPELSPNEDVVFTELESSPGAETPRDVWVPDSTEESVFTLPLDPTVSGEPDLGTPFVPKGTPDSWDTAFPYYPSIDESLAEMEKLSSREVDHRREDLDRRIEQESNIREIVERETLMRNMGGAS